MQKQTGNSVKDVKKRILDPAERACFLQLEFDSHRLHHKKGRKPVGFRPFSVAWYTFGYTLLFLGGEKLGEKAVDVLRKLLGFAVDGVAILAKSVHGGAVANTQLHLPGRQIFCDADESVA